MYPLVAAIDLETTSIDPYRDRIIEIGAVLIRDGKPAERFSELVKPDVPLPIGIVKLTGITPAMLQDARDPAAVLEDFLAFLPEKALCIAHNAQFERAFLRHATGDRFRHVVLDTVELSRICFPTLASHSLSVLAEALELAPSSNAHRALADAETLARLWEKLLEAARRIPLPAVGEINFLLADHVRHPYREFFQRLSAELLPNSFGKNATDLEALFPESGGFVPPPEIDFDKDDDALDPEDLAFVFGPDGPLRRAGRAEASASPHPSVADDQPQSPLPSGERESPATTPPMKTDEPAASEAFAYEHRVGQAQMAQAVARAFNERTHLLVEAGTGIGKSLAYLVPAVRWAVANRQPVIVSTNTKNLQAQLFDKDIPLLRRALGIDFRAALIKGRRNYLCLRKLFQALRQARHELDQEERLRMANILPWAAATDTGDISENIVAGRPGFGTLWAKLSSAGEECLKRGCRYQRRCFLWKARAQAVAADIVVANHSLVFAELGSKSPTLPPWQQIVFDEAHNLEEAATTHLSVECSAPRVLQALGRLQRAGKKQATGLLASVEAQILGARAKIDDDIADQALAAADRARRGVEQTLPAVEPFFAALAGVMNRRADGAGGEATRYTAAQKRAAVWDPIEEAREKLFSGLAEALHAVETLSGALRLTSAEDFPNRAACVKDLDAAAQWLREITEDGVFVLDGGNEDYVYWVEPGFGQGQARGGRAFAAPVTVGKLLYDQLYAPKRSVVFCSATMTVRGSFDFLKARLGIDLIAPERLAGLNAGTPFDYPKQCLVTAPIFLPEPGERGHDYARELGILLAEVFRRTEGRAMGLFTSYDMLSRVADELEARLTGDGIQLLVQGRSGSRENITSVFKRGGRSVLLGTHSFWEGVDVVGEALSCLVIARLPFMVQTDPLVAARSERVESEGKNAFMEYSLPSAVIRFRQGFGRLIRHRTDRGVVVLADRRVAVKRYGQWFRDSLPAPTESFSDREAFLDAIEEFMRQPPPR